MQTERTLNSTRGEYLGDPGSSLPACKGGVRLAPPNSRLSVACVSCRICADDDCKVKLDEWAAGNAHSPLDTFLQHTLST